MKKIGYASVSGIRLDENLNIGVFEIGGIEYILLGGEFCADGVRNYLRPLNKVIENIDKQTDYARSRRDVKLYMDNATVSRLIKDVADIRYDEERQKW